MRSKKRFIAALLLAVLVLLSGCKEETKLPEKISLGILEASNRSAVEAYLEENQLTEEQDYFITEEICNVFAQELLNSTANIDISFFNGEILQMTANFDLFCREFDEEEIAEGDVIEEETPEYSFTQKEKDKIAEQFGSLLKYLEQYWGCQLSEYDLIPLADLGGAEISDPEEAFYEGKVLKEYSVRDRNGILWLLRFDAFDGMSYATLYKIVNENGYEEFVPVVDLTK